MPLFRPFANAEMKGWLLDRKSQLDHDFYDGPMRVFGCQTPGGSMSPLYLAHPPSILQKKDPFLSALFGI